MPGELLIIGTGALACLFAARLAAAGTRVTLLGNWAEGLQALREKGVCLTENGATHRYPVQAVRDPSSCRGAKAALVLVKAWATPQAAAALAACLAPDGLALTLQNGLGNLETLAAALGAERAAAGVTTLGARLAGPGCAVTGGQGQVLLGSHPRLHPLAELLRQAGISVEMTGKLESLLWGKLVINAAVNPVSALLDAPNGALLQDDQALSLILEAAREAAAAAAAQAVALPYPDAEEQVQTILAHTAGNLSSMLQDLRRGARTEIDAINGQVILAAQHSGVPVPVNRSLYRLVKAREALQAPFQNREQPS